MSKHDNEVVEFESNLLIEADGQCQYWTVEKIKEAINNPKPIGKVERPIPNPTSTPEQGGNAIVMDGVPPEEPGSYTPKPVTSKVKPQDYRSPPYSACGKLFFEWKGRPWSGTAWTIAESAIFTAGHNVYDDGEASTNLLFIPQYNDGSKPCGEFYISKFYALKGWTEKRLYKCDLAACVTAKPIRKVTGSLGWIVNMKTDLGPYTAIGYPGLKLPDYPFQGKVMWQSCGPYFYGVKDDYIAAYNNLTRGASGGPWLVTVDGKQYVNGITSNGGDNPDITYSPYFGQGFLNLYEKVSNSVY